MDSTLGWVKLNLSAG
uniref:Uncharacterized protein n=1 Tax=Anguilla anguilla TaxID=7936 RepID=A0A0E9SFM9_ANGAN